MRQAPPEAAVEEGTEEEQEVEAQAEPQAPEMGASEDDQGIGARVTAVFTAAEKAGQHIVTLAREEADDILRQARAEADAYLREQKLQADKEVEQIFADARRKADAIEHEARAVRRALRFRPDDPLLTEFLARRAVVNFSYDRLLAVSQQPYRDLEEGRYDELARLELERLGIQRRSA